MVSLTGQGWAGVLAVGGRRNLNRVRVALRREGKEENAGKNLLSNIFFISSGVGNIEVIDIITNFGILVISLNPAIACIQHFVLRFILWSNGHTPWNYARFLNYATERMILQRVGGRYRFIHRLLQEHFAQMPLE
ncbi:MAG TPA: hypothetical protein V6D28_28440 [Leptolyngbyaceae cyanobacterium]